MVARRRIGSRGSTSYRRVFAQNRGSARWWRREVDHCGWFSARGDGWSLTRAIGVVKPVTNE